MDADGIDEPAGVNGLPKRRRRGRPAAASAVVAVVTVAAVIVMQASSPREDAGTAQAAARCDGGYTVRELPAPPPLSGQQPAVAATDVDPSGRYVAGYAGAGQVGRALLWVDGELRVLDTPGGAEAGAYATGVNAAGAVVGWSTAGCWVYRDGRSVGLPGPGLADPTAINGRGDIVGGSMGGVIWPGDQPGQVRPVGDGGPIMGISDDGLMVGDNGDGEARLWNRDGTVHAQPRDFRARLVAGPWVLGAVGSVGGDRYALWNLTTDATIPLSVNGPGVTGYFPAALSESGAVLITLFTEHGSRPNEQGSRPAVVSDGKVMLLPLPEGQSDIEARAISGDGRTIVGNDSYRTQAVLWRC